MRQKRKYGIERNSGHCRLSLAPLQVNCINFVTVLNKKLPAPFAVSPARPLMRPLTFIEFGTDGIWVAAYGIAMPRVQRASQVQTVDDLAQNFFLSTALS